jgi:phosphoribulokinase
MLAWNLRYVLITAVYRTGNMSIGLDHEVIRQMPDYLSAISLPHFSRTAVG